VPTKSPRTIKVFIASPRDLALERRAFKDTIDELNKGFRRVADVEFVPLGWEDTLSQVGRRSQSVINADVDACDVFVLVMRPRWVRDSFGRLPFGPPGATDRSHGCQPVDWDAPVFHSAPAGVAECRTPPPPTASSRRG
jgi:hypothetical protein